MFVEFIYYVVFIVDVVVKRVDVVCVIVYYQFGFKTGFFEVLCDILVERGGMYEFVSVFTVFDLDEVLRLFFILFV